MRKNDYLCDEIVRGHVLMNREVPTLSHHFLGTQFNNGTMNKRIFLREGDKFGYLTIIEEVESRLYNRRFRCICDCGCEIITTLGNLRHNKDASCGCIRQLKRYKHGLIKHPLYNTWMDMKNRCRNPNNTAYKYYGGRGITVCKEWSVDVSAFIEYMEYIGWNPHCGLSMDRINNNGNYEPGNIRLVNQHLQSINSRLQCNNKTGYKGIWVQNRKKKYVAEIMVNRKKKYIGEFEFLSDAVTARNQYIINNLLFDYEIQEYHG